MKNICIIPARMGSSRFPGKPLHKILGKELIHHVYENCKKSQLFNRILIATPDKEIEKFCKSIDADFIMTSNEHIRASDRCNEAIQALEQKKEFFDITTMVQGDEPMTTPGMISQSLVPFSSKNNINIVNLMLDIDNDVEFEDPNEVKVVVDKNSDAIYFSREPIPSKKKGEIDGPMRKQVCVIPFRRDYLLKFNEMDETQLEKIESVDMLRVIENGEKIKMIGIRSRIDIEKIFKKKVYLDLIVKVKDII